jgi:hypothetical protein
MGTPTHPHTHSVDAALGRNTYFIASADRCAMLSPDVMPRCRAVPANLMDGPLRRCSALCPQ